MGLADVGVSGTVSTMHFVISVVISIVLSSGVISFFLKYMMKNYKNKITSEIKTDELEKRIRKVEEATRIVGGTIPKARVDSLEERISDVENSVKKVCEFTSKATKILKEQKNENKEIIGRIKRLEGIEEVKGIHMEITHARTALSADEMSNANRRFLEINRLSLNIRPNIDGGVAYKLRDELLLLRNDVLHFRERAEQFEVKNEKDERERDAKLKAAGNYDDYINEAVAKCRRILDKSNNEI